MIRWRRKWQPPSVVLTGRSHGQRKLATTVHGSKELDETERLSRQASLGYVFLNSLPVGHGGLVPSPYWSPQLLSDNTFPLSLICSCGLNFVTSPSATIPRQLEHALLVFINPAPSLLKLIQLESTVSANTGPCRWLMQWLYTPTYIQMRSSKYSWNPSR